jgi:transglutaminase-like putative cysteine protease
VSTPFLAVTRAVDWDHPRVQALAEQLRAGQVDPMRISRRCFEWVRDEIKHTLDHGLPDVPCAASEVLEAGHGFCFAKSHLLAALLRANGVPTGFCYQRLALDADGTSHGLHGLNAIRLPAIGWYRVDARGNRAGVDAQFDPPVERLAFPVAAAGEADLPEVWPEPLPIVVDALRRYRKATELADALPDVPLWNTQPARTRT